jgi:peptidyl-prolyl cis-trans isomerase-like 2
MVKRQKEKLYQSSREHRANAAQRAATGGTADAASSTSAACQHCRLLPFSHCALTLTAYETPVCNAQGIVFENSAILPFILKHGMDPCTGEKITTRDLITLNMHQQSDGDDEGGGSGISEPPRWACPIMNKPFVQHSKIVAILLDNNNNNDTSSSSSSTTDNRHANVYSWQAYQELNVQANHYEDLLTGQPFDKKKHVLILYDPNDDDLNRRRDINTFYHITNARKLLQHSSKGKDGKDSSNTTTTIQHGMTATRIMQQLAKNKEQKQQKDAEEQDAASKKRAVMAAAAETMEQQDDDASNNSSNKRVKRAKNKPVLFNANGWILASDVTGVRYTTTGGAASFTSTGVAVKLDNCDRPATEEEILQAQLLVLKQGKSNNISNDGNGTGSSSSSSSTKKLQHKKGLVRIVTNMGDITVELHCDIAPRTCYNFLRLCRLGSYDNSKFHRLIPNFMIQGGKKTTAASSSSSAKNEEQDESYWGNRPFADEFDDRLKHDGPGILSMANSGPHTNRRQFFFTFKACPHLDRKHSVFGHVIDGMQVLQEMEKIPTNTDAKRDHVPLTKIVIQSTITLVDPVQEAIELEQERLDGIIAQRRRKKQISQQQQQQPQQQQTAATASTSGKLIQSAEENDKDSNTATSSRSRSSSSNNNDDVGHFLREQFKLRAAAAATAASKNKKKPAKEDKVEQQPATTSRPPPKSTSNFGNFSGW